jgi:hypothetical protein
MRALSRIFATVRCRDGHPAFEKDLYAVENKLLAGHLVLGTTNMPDSGPPQQLLHLVIGGELTDLEHNVFKDLDKVDIVGVFPNYATAYAAWKAKAQATVDNAQMRYFVVHLHRLLDPANDPKQDTKSSR